jgi:hypothetical protein
MAGIMPLTRPVTTRIRVAITTDVSQPARIKVERFRDRLFYGKVTKIAPMGVEKDNVTTFEVRVSINNPGGELSPFPA